MIAVDAIFTPIRSVHYEVSNVRVGQLTNFDKLEIVMETDGSLSGSEASEIAAHILVDHFSMVFGGAAIAPIVSEQILPETQSTEVSEPKINQQNEIDDTTLSTRAKNALTKNGIVTLAALQAMSNEDIGGLQGLGDKTIKEIIEFLGR